MRRQAKHHVPRRSPSPANTECPDISSLPVYPTVSPHAFSEEGESSSHDGTGRASAPETASQALGDCIKRFLLVFTDRFSVLTATMGYSPYPLVGIMAPLCLRGSAYKGVANIWSVRLVALILWVSTALFSRSPRASSHFSSPIAVEVIVTLLRFMGFAEEVAGWAAYSVLVEEESSTGSVGGSLSTAGVSNGAGDGGVGFLGSRAGGALSRRTGAQRAHVSGAGAGPGVSGGVGGVGLGGVQGAGRVRDAARFYSFCTANAFFVEQLIWFALFFVFVDVSALNSAVMGLYFASCLWWCNFPVLVNGLLMFGYLNAYMCSWIYPQPIRDARHTGGLPVTSGLSTVLTKAYAAYGCSLLTTTLATESNVFPDARARVVEAVVTLPQRVLRLTRNARAATVAVSVYRRVLEAFYFVDFFTCMVFMLYISTLSLSERAATTLGVAVLGTLISPSMLGITEEWQVEPALAFADAMACFSLFLVLTIGVVTVVAVPAMAYVAKAMVAALLVFYAAAQSTHARRRPSAYMALFFLLTIISFGTGAPSPTLPPLVVAVQRDGHVTTIGRITTFRDLTDVLWMDIHYVFSLPASFLFHWATVVLVLQCLVVSSVHCAVLNVAERRRRNHEAALTSARSATCTTSTTSAVLTSTTSGTTVKTKTNVSGTGTKHKDPKPIRATSKKQLMPTASTSTAAETAAGAQALHGTPHNVGVSPPLSGSSSSVDVTPTVSGTQPAPFHEDDDDGASTTSAKDTHSDEATSTNNSLDTYPVDQGNDTSAELLTTDKHVDDTHSSSSEVQTGDDSSVAAHGADLPAADGEDQMEGSEGTLSDSQGLSAEPPTYKCDASPAATASPKVDSPTADASRKGKKTAATEEASTHAPTTKKTAEKSSLSAVKEALPRKSAAQTPSSPPPVPPTLSRQPPANQKKDNKEKQPKEKKGVTVAAAPSWDDLHKSTADTRRVTTSTAAAAIPLPRSSLPTGELKRAAVEMSESKSSAKTSHSSPTVTSSHACASARPATYAAVVAGTAQGAAASAPFSLPKPRHEQTSMVTPPCAVKLQPVYAGTTDVPATPPKPALASKDGAPQEVTTTNPVPRPRSQQTAAAASPHTAPAEHVASVVHPAVPPAVVEEVKKSGNSFLSFLQPLLDSQSAAAPPPVLTPRVVGASDSVTADVSPTITFGTHSRESTPIHNQDSNFALDASDNGALTIDLTRVLQWISDDNDLPSPARTHTHSVSEDATSTSAPVESTDTRALFEFLSRNQGVDSPSQGRERVERGEAASGVASGGTWSVMPTEPGATSTATLPSNMALFSTSAPVRRTLAADGSDYAGLPSDTKAGLHLSLPPAATQESPGSATTASSPGAFLLSASSAFSTVPRRAQAATSGGAGDGLLSSAAFASVQNPPSGTAEHDALVASSFPVTPSSGHPPQDSLSITSAHGDSLAAKTGYLNASAAGQAGTAPNAFGSHFAGTANTPSGQATSPSMVMQSVNPHYYPGYAHPGSGTPGTPPRIPQAPPQLASQPQAQALPAGVLTANQVALVRLPDGRLSLCPVVYVGGNSYVAAPPGSTIVAENPQAVFGLTNQPAPAAFPANVAFPQQVQYVRRQ